jgi:predicted transcriptional regulator
MLVGISGREGRQALNVNETASWAKGGRGREFSGIGPLEAEILALVWARDPTPVSVRELYEKLLDKRQIAYTTVMTVMSNLVKKGLLARDESKTTYLYRAALAPDQVSGEVLDSVVAVLYRGRVAVAAAHLLGLEGEMSEAQLEELRAYARRLLAG